MRRAHTASAADGGAGGGPGGGLSRMMEMVNGSRFGVAVMGLGIHRRSFLEAAIYAAHREQWGQRIDRYPLVRETLVDLLVELEAGAALTFECAAASRTAADEDEGRRMRRILVPLAKIRATREAIWAASQALEVFGGNGYMEDWPMARQLRDAQCHTIWEGTENILCIDVRRAMQREDAHEALLRPRRPCARRRVDAPVVAPVVDAVAVTLADARDGGEAPARGRHRAAAAARRAASRTSWPISPKGALLLDEATWALARDGDARKAVVARRFAPATSYLPRVRGILDDDRTVLDLFEPLVRYGSVDESAAA